VYAGKSEPERRAQRRARLVQAGLELFGTEGWASATIERLCAAAGVATRSFYEEYPSREALLKAVYEDVLSGLVAELLPRMAQATDTPEARIRAGLTSYVDYLTADPRRAKVVHREVRAAGVLEQDRHEMIERFAYLIATETHLEQAVIGRILAVALAGAVAEVLVDWVAQPEPRPDTGPVIDTLVRLFVAAVTSGQA